MLEGDSHVVGVRWEAFVERDGRCRATVEGTYRANVLGVLEGHLAVSTRRVGGGRGDGGRMEVGEGRVVN
jgi:hypothetical protein